MDISVLAQFDVAIARSKHQNGLCWVGGCSLVRKQRKMLALSWANM